MRIWNRQQIANISRAGQPTWYSIKNRADGSSEVMIYDAIGEYGVTAKDFIRDISGIKGNITLRLNTEGGEVFDGIAIYNALASRGGVTVMIDSLAASIGSVIAMAGERVVIAKNATMMIHDASGLAMGNAKDMQEMANLLDRTSANIASIYADRSGTEAAEWRDMMRAETWFTAEEAVAAGLADEVQGAPQGRAQRVSAQARDAVLNKAIPVHHTATEDSDWDGPAAVAAMPASQDTLDYCHAWAESDADPDLKSSYKFPHHRRAGGPANLAACRNGLARLSSADIPEGDRAGVERHLRAHLDDSQSSGHAKIDFSALAEQFRRGMKEAADA